ncbi:MAG: M23 family metallopeptidase [Verrucomicrobiota bacterium JB023]|nr:M23 family metallopeptidase [Verrucomicrobiota bacterium JB023]
MKKKHALTVGVILLAATFLAWAIWQGPDSGPPQVQNLRSWQEADAPGGYEVEMEGGRRVPGFDHRLHLLSGIERFRIPLANRFDFPMGSTDGALTYNAQAFWEMNERRGGRHTGDDLNGIGGMNTDLGDPVFSVANGLVIYAGTPSRGWGKTLIVAHRTEDGEILQSMYAHLHSISVAMNTVVQRGERIGRVGGADGVYPAHLHFEMIDANGLSLSPGYLMHRTNRIDPTGTLEARRGPGPPVSIDLILENAERDQAGF